MSASWTGMYRHLDDDTLAALASAGLLRRAAKDVDAGKVAWAAPPMPDHGIVAADGQQVKLGADGPARARCDCTAPGICKHILAAALWLRERPADAEVPEPGADPLAEAAALAPADVFKRAGIAAVRKAAALFAGCGPVAASASGGVAIMTLQEPPFTCRYVAGGGLAGMVSEAEGAARTALHVLALAALWRERGIAFDWPPNAAPVKDDAEAGLTQQERDIVAGARAMVAEVSRAGWSHVSDNVPAQVRALAMSARVESLPRLAGMLRTLAGTAEQLARRDASSDERQAIRQAARLLALCHALADAEGHLLAALRGSARRSFDGHGSVELMPLGAHWWETRGGARGLTVAFWDSAGDTVLQAVMARRDAGDRMFTRHSAWSMSLWVGAGAASALSAGALLLQQPRLSSDNRLGLASSTTARVLPGWRDDDERWQRAGFSDWDKLLGCVAASAGLRGEPLETVLLRPATVDKPQLDEARQLLWWRLRDVHGRELPLRLPTTVLLRDRIEHLNAWVASGLPIAGVVARIERDMRGTTLEPVSLVVSRLGKLEAVSLDYEKPPSAVKPALLARLARILASPPAAPMMQRVPHHLQAVDALLEILEHKAMTGRMALTESERANLVQVQASLSAIGLDLMAHAVRRYLARPGVEQLLLLVQLCHTCGELDTRLMS